MNTLFTCAAILLATATTAQDTLPKENPPLVISGYAEAYYSFDLNKPADNNKPGFLYSHNRHNEVNLNMGYIKAAYSKDRVRGNLALAAGTYINANYAAEPGVLKNIFEANAGYRLGKNRNIWLDMGIMSSHIGFESAIGKDCWTLTRSLVAENSPYFESGAKISYTSNNGKLAVSALALNGWQRIARVSGNSLMSWGTQVTAKPNDRVTLNYSTFMGTDKPDSARLWRIYHNVYGIFQFNKKIGLIAGFDIGTEQKTKGGNKKNTWFSPVGILRFTPSEKWAMALRGEYFADENGVIVASGTPNGFKTTGVSLNIDYMPATNMVLRLEGRSLSSKDAVFTKNGSPEKNNTMITMAMAISF